MASLANMENQCYSSVNVTNFVTVKPDIGGKGSKYNIWREQMVCLLDSQGLLGLVDGEIQILAAADEEQQHCRRRDRLVKGWILGSIGEDALDAVMGLSTARDVWLELEKILSQEDHIRLERLSEMELANPNPISIGRGCRTRSESPRLETKPSFMDDSDTETVTEDEKGTATSDVSLEETERFKSTFATGVRLRRRRRKWVAASQRENESNMYKAALRGDWEAAEKLIQQDMEHSKALISYRMETPLHVAIGTGKANNFVKNLLELLPDEAVALTDCCGETALHYAARVGNKEAAVMLVNRKPDLQYITNSSDRLAVQVAAIHCQKEVLTYLIQMSKPDVENTPFVGNLGVRFLTAVTASEFFDVALDLVEKYPDLARSGDGDGGDSALSTIARMSRAFPGGESYSCWHNFIYSCIPLESSARRSKWTISTAGDIENHMDAPKGKKSSYYTITYAVSQKLIRSAFSEFLQHLVPQVKRIARKKVMHQQALELVKSLCDKIASLPHDEASAIYEKSIILAAKHGIHEMVQVIVEGFPTSVFAEDPKTGRNIFLLAARERLQNVFNLIYDMSDRKYNFYNSVDTWGNNFMHLCAKIAPSHKLDLVPGPALQMQRELQWFKEAEKLVHPSRREWLNEDGYSPRMLFSEKHRELKAEGERWMRSTANSCSIAAALIATVAFAAAFTVPGGLDPESGAPVFEHRFGLVLFAISDAVSLFTSLTSLLMFLSIMTSRYAEEDFVYVLPRRLSMGLLALFVSITFMMAAFGATLYLVLLGNHPWLLLPVATLACLPVASFVLLQFPLLLDVVYSTYAPGIFGKRTGRILY